MTTANEILRSKLDALIIRLGELSTDHSMELRDIRAVLAEIDESGAEPSAFRRKLKDLAEAVIEARKTGRYLLRDLPIPPYDLWLPFKAQDLTSSDPEDIADAIEIFKDFNHKVNLPISRSASNGSTD